MDTNANAAATTTSTAAAATDQSWWSGFDDETKGYVQNKGLSTKPINEAFTQVSKFHREAEKMIGAPANELVRLPKDPASADWAGVYKRLGALDKPEDYKLEGIKHAGDKPINDALADTLRKAAHAGHMSNDSANLVAKEVVKYWDALETSKQADEAAKLQTEQKLLTDNWGTKYAANKVVAEGAANTIFSALGFPEAGVKEVLENLGKNAGYSKVMEMFRVIGTKIGEDVFISAGGNPANGVMTKDQALAEREELKRDQAWVKRYNAGGIEESRKMQALNKIITATT